MKYSKRKDKYCCNVLNDNFHEIDERLINLEENGGGGGGSGSSDVIYLTEAQYDALPDSKYTDDVEYRITDAGIGEINASNVSYDNSNSGLKAVNTQSALDELSDSLKVGSDVGKTAITVINTNSNFTLTDTYSWYMVVNGICYFQVQFSASGSISSGDNYYPFALPPSAFGNYLYLYSQNGAGVRISSGGTVRVSVSSTQTGSHCVVGSYPIRR